MPNRLASQHSPYLRQHAHNPVDWYPWGDEAFAAARERDVPVLLSVGYSSCHWCHVMERESFDSKETAALMNRHFVNVKVDREERPDVDGIYMGAVQALTGHGGWPLTAFLTPDGLPFYGGTYFPPEPRNRMPAFSRVLEAVHEAWVHRRRDVLENAARLADALARGSTDPVPDGTAGGTEGADASTGRLASGDGEASDGQGGGPAAVAVDAAGGRESGLVRDCRDAWKQLAAGFDPEHGGFGQAPKFPQPVTLDFLLAWSAASGEARPLDVTLHTLRSMALGGIRDHLAGGFHRYSVDRRWLVPHFEKMLYDNALLARTYLDGWRLSGDPFLASVCRETLRYVLDDLRHPRGGFFSARDADSEGEEGTFYLWSPAGVRSAAAAAGLPAEDVERFMAAYDVTDEGNFEGRSILHLERDVEDLARGLGLDPAALDRSLSAVRAALRSARSTREKPFRDEKIICAWNAFAVRALAEAGAALPEPDFVDGAIRGAQFLLDVLRTDDRDDGRGPGLLRIWSEGAARIPAYLEDWAALGNAVLSLHEATLDPRWLDRAVTLTEGLLSRFTDPESGLLHDAPEEADHLPYRTRDLVDSATPSGNSLAMELLLRAGALTGRTGWTARAREMLERERGAVRRAPGAFGRRLAQAVRATTPPMEVALTGDPDHPGTVTLLRTLHRTYHPARVVTGGATDAGEHPAAVLLDGRGPVDGRPAAWVCRRYACRAPVTTAEELRAALGSPG